MEWNGRFLLTAGSEKGREEGGAGLCTPHFSPRLRIREWMLGGSKAKCCNFLKAVVTKVPQTRWYKPQEFIISQFLGLEVQAQVSAVWAQCGHLVRALFQLADEASHCALIILWPLFLCACGSLVSPLL